jgi:hypothetical protein
MNLRDRNLHIDYLRNYAIKDRPGDKMDWRIRNLYIDYLCGYTITQSWWQRIKGKFTGRYEISIITPGQHSHRRTYILDAAHQEKFNSRYLVRHGPINPENF